MPWERIYQTGVLTDVVTGDYARVHQTGLLVDVTTGDYARVHQTGLLVDFSDEPLPPSANSPYGIWPQERAGVYSFLGGLLGKRRGQL